MKNKDTDLLNLAGMAVPQAPKLVARSASNDVVYIDTEHTIKDFEERLRKLGVIVVSTYPGRIK